MSASSKAELARTLEVRHNAKWGFSIGTVLAVAIYVFFVVIPGANHASLLYVTLGFVLAFSTGALVTVIFVARTAVRVAREASENPADPGEPSEESPAADSQVPDTER